MDKILSNEKMYENILLNLVDMDNEEQLKSIPEQLKPEAIINYNQNPYGEIEINLKFNSSLSEERKKKENLKSLYKNVLFIFFDGLSRPQSLKLLPKTSNFIKKFMKYNGYSFKNNNKEFYFHGFEFLKYHAMDAATLGNEQPMFYGKRYDEDSAYNINKYFQENGYITGLANGNCGKESSPISWKKKKGKVLPRYGSDYDHEFYSFSCNPFHGIKWGPIKGPNSVIKRCLYGKMIIEHEIEYANQFFQKYKDNRKYFRLLVQDSHDQGSNHLINFDDDILFKFLSNIYQNNLLNESAVIIASDHGNASAFLLRFFEDFTIEVSLPFLYIILADNTNKINYTQYQNITQNQQNFIHAYDIYNTLSNIIYGNEYFSFLNKNDSNDRPKTDRGKSLFEFIEAKGRNCHISKDFDKGCQCVNYFS